MPPKTAHSKIAATVIIPTYNGAQKVCTLLRNLVKQVNDNIEVIVIIDGSTDKTSEEIVKLDLGVANLVIKNQVNMGRSGARNSGASIARGGLLIFFDDDIIPTDTLIQDHINSQSKNKVVVGALRPYDRHGNREMFRFSEYLNKKWSSDIEQAASPYITAANFSIDKDLFHSLGGFDDRLNDSEDLDLAVRLTVAGHNIVHVSSAIAFIPLNATFTETFIRLKEYKNGRAVLNATNHSVKDFISASYKPPLLKRIFFFLFSFSFLYRLADLNFFLFLPKSARMKLYDWMMTGNMMY